MAYYRRALTLDEFSAFDDYSPGPTAPEPINQEQRNFLYSFFYPTTAQNLVAGTNGQADQAQINTMSYQIAENMAAIIDGRPEPFVIPGATYPLRDEAMARLSSRLQTPEGPNG